MHGFNALPQGKHGSRLSSYILYAASGMRTIPGAAIARERFASVERILAPPQHFNPLAVLQAKKNHPPGRSTTSYLKISIMTNLSLTQEINEFNSLIEMVRSHGTKWAPTQDRLKLASLQSQAEALTNLHDTLSSAYHNLGEVTKKRKQALQSALIQARKIRFSLNIHLGEDHPQKLLLDQLFKQINPRPRTVKSQEQSGQPEPEGPKRTTYQTKFTDRLDQFARLNTILKSQTDYEPSETNLSAEAWETTLTTLQTLNKSTLTLQAQLNQHRDRRDQFIQQLQTLQREIRQYHKVLQA